MPELNQSRNIEPTEEPKEKPYDPAKVLLDVLRQCRGYYKCPKDEEGRRLGPLVGYAGRDEQGRQFVGDVYANCSALERHPVNFTQYCITHGLVPKHKSLIYSAEVFCGAPMGGLSLALLLAEHRDCHYVFAEKKITALATATEREKSVLIFKRHQIKPDSRVAIVEDVCNNFSTTDQLIDIIQQCGGRVAFIVCILNRSLRIEDNYNGLPVLSLIRQPIPQYSQDDPEVVEDITKGNVVWKPKDD